MTSMTDFERRLGAWLEDGPETIPDWLVEQSIAEAHTLDQLRGGIRWPWLGRPLVSGLGRPATVAAGAVGALAVVSAFVLGVLFAPAIGNEHSPTPGHTQSAPPASPPNVVSRPLAGVQIVDVLPGETGEFLALIGLTSTGDSVWTSVVTADSARLVRIDASTGHAVPVTIPGAGAMLSPPTADGDVIWTGSTAGLHRIGASLTDDPRTLPLPFVPAEIGVAPGSLWIARSGGTTLVDPATGAVIRSIEADRPSRRIIGAPAVGSLWSCIDALTFARIDPGGGGVTGSVDLPSDSDCHGPVFESSGVDGVEDGVIPFLTTVIVDPASATVSSPVRVGAWSDVISIGGRLWFLEVVRDRPGPGLALVALDPVSRGPAQILTFEGALHLNAAFETGYMAVAGDFLWVLADPAIGGTIGERPRLVRIPLSELAGR